MSSNGKVIGQLNSITTQSEQGTTEAMTCLEKSIAALDSIVKELGSLKSCIPQDSMSRLEQQVAATQDQLYGAMSAFQFQDINTQKLYKVMSMLGELSDYLNDLVGFPNPRPKYVVASGIESVDLEKDKNKGDVDDLIKQFQQPASTPAP
jgi:hypothetical protein